MRKLFLAISAAALISIAGYVIAQTDATETDAGTKMRLAAMDTSPTAFRKLDADNDGRISALEAAENPRVAAAFTMADKDKDGYLSKEEFGAMSSSSTTAKEVDASSPSGDRATSPSGDRATYPSGGGATNPSGDRVSDPSGDQSATSPSEPSPTSTSPAPHSIARSKN